MPTPKIPKCSHPGVNLPKIIKHQTPDFSHTFAVNFAVFVPNQDGDKNHGKVHLVAKLTPRRWKNRVTSHPKT